MAQLTLNKRCLPMMAGYRTTDGYQPSLAAGVLFHMRFGASMVAHTAHAVWSRNWWCLLFSIGCLSEILGWAARIWSAECPYERIPFLMQFSTLILGIYRKQPLPSSSTN
ncbi:hypothetical protein BBP40_010899 [Aspergillus hancockii]|nr:hypothetical protein BBP40_010899 [Aspergillus hancockii]